MRSTNSADYGSYLRYLKTNTPDLELLRNALTINVTEFIRDTKIYEAIRKEILPDLFKLGKANEGIFSPKAMVKLTKTQTHRHFDKFPHGNYQAKPHLKELIKFTPNDLISGVPVSHFLVLITCRNVTIYFNEEQKDDLAYTFHDALVADGYYIMGKTEYLGRGVDGLFVPKNTAQKFLSKKRNLRPKRAPNVFAGHQLLSYRHG